MWGWKGGGEHPDVEVRASTVGGGGMSQCAGVMVKITIKESCRAD